MERTAYLHQTLLENKLTFKDFSWKIYKLFLNFHFFYFFRSAPRRKGEWAPDLVWPQIDLLSHYTPESTINQ